MGYEWRIYNSYFNLEKVARQGDPISAYMFILALEVLFELIKSNADIRGITIFNHAFLYTMASRWIQLFSLMTYYQSRI